MLEREANIGLVKVVGSEQNQINGSGFILQGEDQVVTAWHLVKYGIVVEDVTGEQRDLSFRQVGEDLAFSIDLHKESEEYKRCSGIPIAETLDSYGNAEVIGYDPKTGEVFRGEVIYFRTDEERKIGVVCVGENSWTLSRGMSGSIVAVDGCVVAILNICFNCYPYPIIEGRAELLPGVEFAE